MIYRKITTGFVIQEFSDDGKPISQEFIAGDEVDYENEDGEAIDMPENDTYLPFEMVQPS
jgi:hypothetical protein